MIDIIDIIDIKVAIDIIDDRYYRHERYYRLARYYT